MSLPTQYNGRNQDPVGGLSSTLARLQANKPLRELREIAKGISKTLPPPLQARRALAVTTAAAPSSLPSSLPPPLLPRPVSSRRSPFQP